MSHRSGPSAWSHRLPLLGLTACGFAVAAYLTAFQVRVIGAVWEPLFGDGSVRILTSDVARALPIPDASIGVAAYLLEGLLALSGGSDRWWRHPSIVLLMGVVMAGMALGSIGLILIQTVGFGTGCSLCLASGAISLVLAALAAPEVGAAVRRTRELRRAGVPLRDVLRGTGPVRPRSQPVQLHHPR